jgi:hypothetical protein
MRIAARISAKLQGAIPWSENDRCRSLAVFGIRHTLMQRLCKWLPHQDLNLDKQSQNLLCYRYTMRQMGGRHCHLHLPARNPKPILLGSSHRARHSSSQSPPPRAADITLLPTRQRGRETHGPTSPTPCADPRSGETRRDSTEHPEPKSAGSDTPHAPVSMHDPAIG